MSAFLTNTMGDSLVNRLSYDLNEAREQLDISKEIIDSKNSEIKDLRERNDRLIKDITEITDKYLSMIEKVKKLSCD